MLEDSEIQKALELELDNGITINGIEHEEIEETKDDVIENKMEEI